LEGNGIPSGLISYSVKDWGDGLYILKGLFIYNKRRGKYKPISYKRIDNEEDKTKSD
jgi:hypothetical protein